MKTLDLQNLLNFQFYAESIYFKRQTIFDQKSMLKRGEQLLARSTVLKLPRKMRLWPFMPLLD